MRIKLCTQSDKANDCDYGVGFGQIQIFMVTPLVRKKSWSMSQAQSTRLYEGEGVAQSARPPTRPPLPLIYPLIPLPQNCLPSLHPDPGFA